MRVLFISGGDYKYGAPKALMELVLTLKEQHGVEPIVLTKKSNLINQWCDEHQIENYSYWYRDIMAGSAYSSKMINCLKHVIKYILFICGGISQRWILKSIPNIDKIDLIHTNLNRLDIGTFLSYKTGVPQVCHLRELRSGHSKIIFYKKNCINYLNKGNSRFFAISDHVKENWIDAGIDENKINVVYDGIDTKQYEDYFPKKFDELSIACVGRIEENKGQEQIIDAFHQLPLEVLEHTKLLLIGEAYEEYKKRLLRRIRKYGLEKKVSFLGYCDNVPQKLQECNIGITSSKGEAFGRVTVEYMAAGLVPVVSDTGANSEIVSDHIEGLLYPYGNSEMLAECLSYLFFHKQEAERISKAGKQKVLHNYSKERNANEIYEQYCQIIDVKNRDINN